MKWLSQTSIHSPQLCHCVGSTSHDSLNNVPVRSKSRGEVSHLTQSANSHIYCSWSSVSHVPCNTHGLQPTHVMHAVTALGDEAALSHTPACGTHSTRLHAVPTAHACMRSPIAHTCMRYPQHTPACKTACGIQHAQETFLAIHVKLTEFEHWVPCD